ncbi:MAG: DNA polymerase III subunit beta [Clostridia bacterium]
MLKLSRKNLVGAVEKVVNTTESNSTLPILKCIQMNTDKGQLVLNSTNLTVFSQSKLPVEGTLTEPVCIDGKFFYDFVRKVDGETVTIEIKENTAHIVCGAVNVDVQIQNASEFPDAFKQDTDDVKMVMNEDLFAKAIRHVVFAVGTDSSKPLLQCVNFVLDNSLLTLAAVDGYRVAVYNTSVETEHSQVKKSINVPGDALKLVTSILSKEKSSDSKITLTFTPKFLTIEHLNSKFIIKLFEGEFLNYTSFLGAEWKTCVNISRQEFINGLELLDLFKTKEGTIAILNMTDGNLNLNSFGDNGNISKDIPVEIQGEDLKICFRSQYIGDVLKIIEAEKVNMLFSGQLKASIIKPNAENYNYLYLALPIRMRDKE